MNREGNATLYRRGSGTRTERWVESGTLEDMVERLMEEVQATRRNFTIVQDDMEYQASEIENLAQQFRAAALGVRPYGFAPLRPHRGKPKS